MVRDLMIALGIDRATIVGHSLGGGIAMQLAYQHPLRCERLVLVASGGLGPEISWIFRALTVPGAEYLMPLIFPAVRPRRRQRHRQRAPPARRTRPATRGGLAVLRRAHRAGEPRTPSSRTLRSVIDPSGQTVSAHDRLYLGGACRR